MSGPSPLFAKRWPCIIFDLENVSSQSGQLDLVKCSRLVMLLFVILSFCNLVFLSFSIFVILSFCNFDLCLYFFLKISVKGSGSGVFKNAHVCLFGVYFVYLCSWCIWCISVFWGFWCIWVIVLFLKMSQASSVRCRLSQARMSRVFNLKSFHRKPGVSGNLSILAILANDIF